MVQIRPIKVVKIDQQYIIISKVGMKLFIVKNNLALVAIPCLVANTFGRLVILLIACILEHSLASAIWDSTC